ncbi:hypothetical protein N0V82_005934 [Gnomoniopsis sp. IMI 355080]|nr:hypothetical protein N0V82_005934 [Gnomoniopsis sp. IMI 355080]
MSTEPLPSSLGSMPNQAAVKKLSTELTGEAQMEPLQEVGAAAEAGASVRDRRREKQQLSCTFCRRRKLRCDRQLPCKTCADKGIALACTYLAPSQSNSTSKVTVSVSERIQQLEALVHSMAQQMQNTAHNPATSAGLTKIDPGKMTTTTAKRPHVSANEAAPSAAVLEPVHSLGENYVSSVHWSAVLDSISELKDQYDKEETARVLANSESPRHKSGPRLLYEPVHATKSEILATIPARPIVDRLIARYFNAQGVAPVVNF